MKLKNSVLGEQTFCFLRLLTNRQNSSVALAMKLPRSQNVDLGLRKIFAISERQKLQLRLEAFNAPNHPNFGNPNMNIDAGPGAAAVVKSRGCKSRHSGRAQVPILTVEAGCRRAGL